MPSVVNPEAEGIFEIGMLDVERGNSHCVLLIHDPFLDVFGRDRRLLRREIGYELAAIIDIGVIGLFEVREYVDAAMTRLFSVRVKTLV